MKEYYGRAVLAMGEKSLDTLRPFAQSARIALIGGMAVSFKSPGHQNAHRPSSSQTPWASRPALAVSRVRPPANYGAPWQNGPPG